MVAVGWCRPVPDWPGLLAWPGGLARASGDPGLVKPGWTGDRAGAGLALGPGLLPVWPGPDNNNKIPEEEGSTGGVVVVVVVLFRLFVGLFVVGFLFRASVVVSVVSVV